MGHSNREPSRLTKAAVRYARRGWYVFPLKPRDKVPLTAHGFKDATNDPEAVREAWKERPDSNIGLVPGPSGLVVIDADGQAGRQSLQAAGLLSEPTLTVTTGRGIHRYYPRPAGEVTANDIGPGTTVRCDKGYVVAPPSIHPSGTRYEWDRSFDGLGELPPQAVALLCRKREPSEKPVPASPVPAVIPVGARNNTLTSLAGMMQRSALPESVQVAALHAANVLCAEPLPESEVGQIVRSVSRYEPAAPARGAVPMVVTMGDVEPEAVGWLWPGYIPLGKLTVLEGDPGLGKSTLALAIAAAVSRGLALPGGVPGDPAHVILISYEDAVADTLRPRLDAARADVTRVHAIVGMQVTEDVERLVTLPADGRSIFDVVQRYDARLIIVDTLTCALASDTDAHRDADVRRALAPLAKLAEETGAAVLVIRHLRKSGGKAIVSGGGSIGIGGAARSVLGVYTDPDDDDAGLLAVVKANLAKRSASLHYKLVSEDSQAAHVVWGRASHLTADHLAGLRTDDAGGEGSDREADDWLRGVLEAAPLDRRDALKLGKDAGFSDRTIQRAAVRIGAKKVQSGFGKDKRSVWSLPNRANPAEQGGMARMAGLEELGTVGQDDRPPNCSVHGPAQMTWTEDGYQCDLCALAGAVA